MLGAPLDESGATVRVVSSNPVQRDLRVRTDGSPFWLVFGESADAGWEADAPSGEVGPRQVVNGFANGWLVTPARAGTMDISMQWTPQRYVWFGFVVSAIAVLACIVLVVLGILAIIIPPIATIAVTIFLGWLFLISGIVGLVTTFWARHAPGFWW